EGTESFRVVSALPEDALARAVLGPDGSAKLAPYPEDRARPIPSQKSLERRFEPRWIEAATVGLYAVGDEHMEESRGRVGSGRRARSVELLDGGHEIGVGTRKVAWLAYCVLERLSRLRPSDRGIHPSHVHREALRARRDVVELLE